MRAVEHRKHILLAFTIATFIRSIPNILTAEPIGFDTVFYAAQIIDWRHSLSDPNLIFKTPLELLVLAPIHAATSLEPFIIFRLSQPLLYGFLAASFYYATKNLLQWKPSRVLAATIMLSLQPAMLRMSWDLFRNQMGLAILFIALAQLNSKKLGTFAILSVLVVLSHEAASMILLVIIGLQLFSHIRNKEHLEGRRTALYSIPAILLFTGTIINMAGTPILPLNGSPSIYPNAISVPFERTVPFPFANYLAGDTLVDYNQSYLLLLVDVLSLFVASYIFILPFIAKGFRQLENRMVTVWTSFCTLGASMPLITPQFALLFWDRWMQLLVIPYSLYATIGLEKASIPNIMRISKRNLTVIIYAIFAITALLYMATPSTNPLSPYALISPASRYSPPTMLANTVPVQEVSDTQKVLQWLNGNIGEDSCLITRDTFFDWSKIHLNAQIMVINYQSKAVQVGLQYAQTLGYSTIYWIWWTENGIGVRMYGQHVPDDFSPVYQSGDIVLYVYVGI